MERPAEPPSPTPEERLAPGRRPDRRAVMHQSWRRLLFLHWKFPPETVAPLLPKGLDLDTYQGWAYVGLVPFFMTGVRPARLPAVPWLSHFPETNVRTYVHRKGRDPGVWFLSLEAANPVAVALGRSWFHLPYFHARMKIEELGDKGSLRYTSQRRSSVSPVPTTNIECLPGGSGSRVSPGTLDHFLIERYLLYARAGKHLCQGQVHHSPYFVQTAGIMNLEENLIAATGLLRPSEKPLVHWATGVDVEIFSLQKLHGS